MARYVLVHGAFGGAWCWQEVVPRLEGAGHEVVAVDLPGGGDDTTPVADVTLDSCARRVCDALTEPSILVGHSMGGAVITQAAGNCPENIERLVFVCAFMPGDGQSLLALTDYPEGADDQIQANLAVSGDPPVATLSDEAFANAIYNRCSPEIPTWAVPRLRPQAVAVFAAPVSVDDQALARIPRSYVLTNYDQSIPPALQRRMIEEHPCERVTELDTDHAPYFSATDALVGALLAEG